MNKGAEGEKENESEWVAEPNPMKEDETDRGTEPNPVYSTRNGRAAPLHGRQAGHGRHRLGQFALHRPSVPLPCC